MTTDSSTGDWTPERMREARERCERARGDTLDAIEAARVAARADLPAALAEIERLTAERAELRTIRDGAVRGLKDRIAALEAELAARAPADASRPTLTEEQAREMAHTLASLWIHGFDRLRLGIAAALLRAARGETGPASPPRNGHFAIIGPATGEIIGCTSAPWMPSPHEVGEPEATFREVSEETCPSCAAVEPSRNPGSLPSGLTSAMHAAQQRRSVPPASAFGEWPDEPRGGLTCPGCYDATGIAQPHDPRATASPFAPGSLAAGSATEDRILDRKRGGK